MIKRIFATTVLAAALAGCAAGTQPSRTLPALPAAEAAAAGAQSARLSDTIAPATSLGGSQDRGPAPKNATMKLALVLQYRNERALEQLLSDQRRRGSASYHRWLTNEQFATKFGPAPEAYAAVVASLRRAGLNVTQLYENRTVVDVSGTVDGIQRYFRTSIHSVEQPGHGDRLANVRDAHAPAALRGILYGVDGLSTLDVISAPHDRWTAGVSSAARPSSKAFPTAPLFGPVSDVTNAFGYGPAAFQHAYDYPSLHQNGGGGTFDGTGRTAGIVIDADYSDVDLAAYLKYFRIHQAHAPKRVPVDGGAPKASADVLEATLDVETMSGNAPGAEIYIYEIPSLALTSVTDAYNKIVSANLTDVVDSSFGGPDAVFPQTARDWDRIAIQGAVKGITFAAATGDSAGGIVTEAPAASPHFAAIGGTSLTIGKGGAWGSEIGWSGGGGGVDVVFPEPTWQRGVPGTIDRGRNLPDVSLDADPRNGAALYVTETWDSSYNPLGGTSLASPLFAAAVAELCQMKNTRVGLSSEALFNAFAAGGYGTTTTYFHDIVLGNNEAFYTGPGYDLVTGIGSIDFYNLSSEL